MHLAKLVLQRTHRKSGSSGKVLRSARDVTLVRIPQDLLSLDVRVKQPDLSEPTLQEVKSAQLLTPWTVQMGRKTVLIVLSTGRNHVSRAKVKLSSQNVQFEHTDAVLAPGGYQTSSERQAGTDPR